MNLAQLGWSSFFAESFNAYAEEGLVAGRIAREDRHSYWIQSERGALLAEVSGRLRYRTTARGELPAVGDWVAFEARGNEGTATIYGVLPRKSRFSRKAAGGGVEEQVVAANVDTIFLVVGLDGDFNIRRIERFLTPAWNSGANPVVLLNKSDVCDDTSDRIEQVRAAAMGVPVHAISAARRDGLEVLSGYLQAGQTVALLGSSGVGKSTLINAMLGVDHQRVQEVSDYRSHGQHTTTHRELIVLPAGGILIDTPGMRELQLWGASEDLGGTFEDVEELAGRCRFRDCQHGREPGCAVREALEEGRLDRGRYENYLKMQKELRFLALRQSEGASAAEKARWKKIHQSVKRMKQRKWRE